MKRITKRYFAVLLSAVVLVLGYTPETCMLITLDYTLNDNTHILYQWKNMDAGDAVSVIVDCSDSRKIYRVGIQSSDGVLTYVQGSGRLNHIFTIKEDGNYAVYIENRGKSTMKVIGTATYSD